MRTSSFSRVLLLTAVIALVACHPSTPPVDPQYVPGTIQTEQRQQEEAAALRAKIMSAHRTLSETQLKKGLLYMAGGGEDPFGVYYLSDSGSGALITALDMNARARMVKLQGSELAFVANNGDIGFYDLMTGERRSIAAVSGMQTDCLMSNQVPVQDFLIKGVKIFMVVQACGKDGMPLFTLQSFDTTSQKSSVIADITSTSVDGAGIVFDVVNSSDKKIRLRSAYGDAGSETTVLSDVNVATGKVTPVKKLSFENCDAPSVCDAKVLRANAEFEKYSPENVKTQCGVWTIEQQGDMVLHGPANVKISVALASLIACLAK